MLVILHKIANMRECSILLKDATRFLIEMLRQTSNADSYQHKGKDFLSEKNRRRPAVSFLTEHGRKQKPTSLLAWTSSENTCNMCLPRAPRKPRTGVVTSGNQRSLYPREHSEWKRYLRPYDCTDMTRARRSYDFVVDGSCLILHHFWIMLYGGKFVFFRFYTRFYLVHASECEALTSRCI